MKKNVLTAMLVCASLFGAAGCSSSTDTSQKEPAQATESADNTNGTANQESTDQSTASTSQDGEIIIDHALGQTILEEVPERIAAIGWENQDTPLALGIAPVGTSKANYGALTKDGLHVWTQEAFEGLGVDNPVVFDDTDGLDYEAIANTHPDVILASYSGLTQEEYDRLSGIAPVVAYPSLPWQTLWREQTEMNARAIGKEQEGKDLVAKTEELIEEKTAAYPDLKGIKTAFLWVSPDDLSSFYVYTPNDPRAAYLLDLGLEFPQSVKDLQSSSSDFSVTVSRENADQLNDVEMIVVYGNEDLVSALQNDPLLSQIPAIQNGAIAVIDENSDLAGGATPSILSIPYNIDAYLKLLDNAAQNVK